jgi:proliferating cell nuclear antigen
MSTTTTDESSEEQTSETEEEAETPAEDVPEEEAEAAPDLTTEAGGFSCIAEVSVLKDYFETFSTIVDEMKLNIDRDGFVGRVVDPANVAMVEDELDESAFEHYSSTGGVIGVNVNRFDDILSLGDTGDLVELELDQETRKLEVQIGGLEYTLALIDPDSIRAEPDIPDLDLPAEVVVEAPDIDRAITAADMVTDHIRFRVGTNDDGEDAFFLEGSGDTDDVDLTLTREDLIDLQAGEADSLFSLDYFKDFNKAIPTDAEVRIEVGTEFPVKLHYDHIEVDDELRSSVTMMLAPRIQSD